MESDANAAAGHSAAAMTNPPAPVASPTGWHDDALETLDDASGHEDDLDVNGSNDSDDPAPNEATPVAKPVRTLPADISREVGLDALPITPFQEQIVTHVAAHQLTVIQAETGAGKSTRVPQMLYRELGGATNIFAVQPRRIAAVSLAKRVASELDVELGNEVGYRIGADSVVSRSTGITFVTAGWLLQMLVNNPKFVEKERKKERKKKEKTLQRRQGGKAN